MNRLIGVLLLALSLSATSCARVDIEQALGVIDVFTGWYDFGKVGESSKLVPSVTFKLRNSGDSSLDRVLLLVSFWPEDADNEKDSKTVTGIGPEGLAPGASTEPILVRADVGYTLDPPQTKDDLFGHSLFKDFVVKVFARRDGRMVPLGEFPVERRIIPATATQPAAQ
jgi:hypothetical protein